MWWFQRLGLGSDGHENPNTATTEYMTWARGPQPNLEPLFLHLLQRGSHFHVCCGSRHLPQAVQWLHNGGRGKYMGRGVKAKLSSFSWLRSYFGLKGWELRL